MNFTERKKKINGLESELQIYKEPKQLIANLNRNLIEITKIISEEFILNANIFDLIKETMENLNNNFGRMGI